MIWDMQAAHIGGSMDESLTGALMGLPIRALKALTSGTKQC